MFANSWKTPERECLRHSSWLVPVVFTNLRKILERAPFALWNQNRKMLIERFG